MNCSGLVDVVHLTSLPSSWTLAVLLDLFLLILALLYFADIWQVMQCCWRMQRFIIHVSIRSRAVYMFIIFQVLAYHYVSLHACTFCIRCLFSAADVCLGLFIHVLLSDLDAVLCSLSQFCAQRPNSLTEKENALISVTAWKLCWTGSLIWPLWPVISYISCKQLNFIGMGELHPVSQN